MFGRRLLCLWGQFVGTYSALAYAAYAGWRGRERPVRCGFAVETLGRAERCIGMPCACLCSCPAQRASGFGRGDLDFGRDDDGQVEGDGGDADGGTGVASGVGSVEVDDELGATGS